MQWISIVQYSVAVTSDITPQQTRYSSVHTSLEQTHDQSFVLNIKKQNATERPSYGAQQHRFP